MNRPSRIPARGPGGLHRRLVLVLCLIVWTGAVIATHTPADRLPQSGVSDKLLHAVGYFVLTGVLWLTLSAYQVSGLKRIALIFFAMLAYAAIDEITQPLVGREDSFGDWLADVIGATASLVLFELLALGRAWSAPRPKG